jgi:hypothetical protein
MAPARKDLTAEKFALLEAMAVDRRLTALDISLGTLLLSRYLNSQTLDAWPSPKRLAADLHELWSKVGDGVFRRRVGFA